MSAKSLQSCPILCNPMDCGPPGTSMGLSRQEYWSALQVNRPGDLPNIGIEPKSLLYSAFAGGFLTTSTTWEAPKAC